MHSEIEYREQQQLKTTNWIRTANKFQFNNN